MLPVISPTASQMTKEVLSSMTGAQVKDGGRISLYNLGAENLGQSTVYFVRGQLSAVLVDRVFLHRSSVSPSNSSINSPVLTLF